MRRKEIAVLVISICITLLLTGCASVNDTAESVDTSDTITASGKENSVIDTPPHITVLENGLSAVEQCGDDYFEDFLANGGASSDSAVMAFLAGVLSGTDGASFGGNPFGCSTISVASTDGEQLFGRNFDWNTCDALIVKNVPEDGYVSISTVNTDFIVGISFDSLPDETKALIAVYAPLDGMNEKGLCVSVNMISDTETIEQNTNKPDITTTTAIRLLLNKASTTDEAIRLLSEYDLHASFGYMVHFAISDANGNSVAVEYINNEMVVTETPILTNFYIAEGEKYGIGTTQSHTRYEILSDKIAQGTMSENDVKDALSSVSKKNFGEFESTEWSILFNQTTGEIQYYHRENYENMWLFKLSMEVD